MMMIIAFILLITTIAILMSSGVVMNAANSVSNITIIPK